MGEYPMKYLVILAAALTISTSPAWAVDPPIVYPPFGAGDAGLAWGAPYALPITVIAGGLIRMYYVGEIEKRCWTENDNQAVLVGPMSSGSKKCYQGPGAVKYKAP